jgi:hypothetical protein
VNWKRFAQLGTELDKATQAQLDRGYRMVEILKQPQYKPMHVADQVMIIFAGTRGLPGFRAYPPRRRLGRTIFTFHARTGAGSPQRSHPRKEDHAGNRSWSGQGDRILPDSIQAAGLNATNLAVR